VIYVRDLDAEGITIGDETGTSSVQGDVRITLPRNGKPVGIAADVRGQMHPSLLASFGIDLASAARMKPFRFALAGEIAAGSGIPTGTARVGLVEVVVADLPPATLDLEVNL